MALFFCDRAGFKRLGRLRLHSCGRCLARAGGSGVTSARNHLSGLVTDMLLQGRLVTVTVDCGFPLRAVITRGSREELGLETGSVVVAAIKAGAVHLVPRSG